MDARRAFAEPMQRAAAWSRCALAGSLALVACGGSTQVSEADLYYAASLRPGVELAATPGERALLPALAAAVAGPHEVEGERFELGPIYDAASGRRCRRVTTALRLRLACAGGADEGEAWTFVPDPFGAELTAERQGGTDLARGEPADPGGGP